MDNGSKIIDKIYFVVFIFVSLNFVSTYETTHTKKRENKTEKSEDSKKIDKKKKNKKKVKKNIDEKKHTDATDDKKKDNFDINTLEDTDLTLPSLDKIMENSGSKYKPLDYKYYIPFISDISIGIETIGLFRSLIYLIKYPPKVPNDKDKKEEKTKYFDYDVQLHFNTKFTTGNNFVIGTDYGWQLTQIHTEKNKFTTKGIFLEPHLGFKQEYNIIESIIYSINFGIAFPNYVKYEQLEKNKNRSKNNEFKEILKDEKSIPIWLGIGIMAEKKLFYNFYGCANFCVNYLINKTKHKEYFSIPNFGRACNTINFNFNLFIQYNISMRDRCILI